MHQSIVVGYKCTISILLGTKFAHFLVYINILLNIGYFKFNSI